VTYQDVNRPASTGDGSGTEKAKQKASDATREAGAVARTAQSAAGDIASEAGDQAKVFLEEARTQARDFLSTAQDQLMEQAQDRTQRASMGMRDLADQMRALAEGRPQDAGRMADWARQGQRRLAWWSSRLEQGGPEGLARDVAGFARRRPLAFLGACVGAGFLAGRLVKDVAAANGSSAPSPSGMPTQRASDGTSRAVGPGSELPAPSGTAPLDEPISASMRARP
jgi:hypothetical protein